MRSHKMRPALAMVKVVRLTDNKEFNPLQGFVVR